MCDESNTPRIPKPKKVHPVFSLSQLLDASIDIINSHLFLAPLSCIIRKPVDATYDFSKGTVTLTLYYRPLKFKVPNAEVMDGYVRELKDLPVDINERQDGDKVFLELSDVSRFDDKLTITRKVIAELDYRTLTVTLYFEISFAHKVL